MAIQRFLAFTEAEMGGISDLPEKIAWMGLHFSSHFPGITPPPASLPSGSLLILDDRIPLKNQDLELICRELLGFISEFSSPALLLDFQRPKSALTEALVNRLAASLPVILPPEYADGRECPVFLPPVPPDTSLAEFLRPWSGREIWLELALDGQEITLTESGALSRPLPYATPCAPAHREERLHCHYHMHIGQEEVRFTLWRTREDAEALVAEAEEFGVMGCVGLWQEFKPSPGGKVPRRGG